MEPEECHTYNVGASRVTIGRFTYGHDHLVVREWGEGASLYIGAFCSLAPLINVFLGGNHRTDWVTTYPFGHINVAQLGGEEIRGHPSTRGDVTIGNDVWIGQGVTILSGVTIGDGAVVSAGAVVSRNVGRYEIVAGNPARTVRLRFHPAIIDLLIDLSWWELPVSTIREIAPNLCSTPTEPSLRALIARTRKLHEDEGS